jgi:hypothetical protein
LDQLPFSLRYGFFDSGRITLCSFGLAVGKSKGAGIIILPFFFPAVELYTVAEPSVAEVIREENGLPVLNK